MSTNTSSNNSSRIIDNDWSVEVGNDDSDSDIITDGNIISENNYQIPKNKLANDIFYQNKILEKIGLIFDKATILGDKIQNEYQMRYNVKRFPPLEWHSDIETQQIKPSAYLRLVCHKFGFADDNSTIPILILFDRLLCALYKINSQDENLPILEIVARLTNSNWDKHINLDFGWQINSASIHR